MKVPISGIAFLGENEWCPAESRMDVPFLTASSLNRFSFRLANFAAFSMASTLNLFCRKPVLGKNFREGDSTIITKGLSVPKRRRAFQNGAEKKVWTPSAKRRLPLAKGGFFPEDFDPSCQFFWLAEGAPREKNIRLLRALRLRGSQKVAFLQSTTNGSHYRRSGQSEHTLITPRATRGGQTPKGIIFPEDSATLGLLSIWPRGDLLLEKCLKFAFYWPWAISPSAALATQVAEAIDMGLARSGLRAKSARPRESGNVAKTFAGKAECPEAEGVRGRRGLCQPPKEVGKVAKSFHADQTAFSAPESS
jgi:hypothetical protein